MERFWSKVDKTDECWLWVASTDRGGYGHFGDAGKMVRAHRFSWELVNGPIPEGMQVDHRCHVRRCVNPAHLRLVTNQQNGQNRSGCNRNSTSGVRGVSLEPSGRWRVRVMRDGKSIYGGMFDTVEEANEAAVALRQGAFR